MKKKARTTYRNCLRFLFRRGPCVWINACQIAIMISFLLFIAGALMIFFMARYQNNKLLGEDIQYEKLKNEISFAHCDYIPASMEKEFNTQFCGDRSRELAFAWRYFKTNSTNQTCFDLHEQIDCHPYLIQNSLPNFKRPEKFSMCSGLLNVGFDDTKEKDNEVKTGDTVVVWGPQIDDVTLMTEYKDKILHSSELFVKCPKCEAGNKFRYQKKENQCYEKIETVETGWPAIAETCDNMRELPPNFPTEKCTAES